MGEELAGRPKKEEGKLKEISKVELVHQLVAC